MPDAVGTVLNSWWWTERPSETCRVIFNKLENCASSWFYYRKMHVLFLSYDRNTGSCICLSLHLLMYFIIISHKNHCTGMSSQVTECGFAVKLSNGLWWLKYETKFIVCKYSTWRVKTASIQVSLLVVEIAGSLFIEKFLSMSRGTR